MVHFLFDSAGCDASAYIKGEVQNSLEKGNKKTMVIVPEQFSFETERAYFKFLGPQQSKYVEVLSFTRLANKIFREFGGLAQEYADDSTKHIMMYHTLQEVRDQLEIYRGSIDKVGFLEYALEAVGELKKAGIQPPALEEAAEKVRQNTLKSKLEEIFHIYSVYDGLLAFRYADALDDLRRALQKIESEPYFQGYVIYFYGFHHFDASQYAMIQKMMASAKEMYFTLAMDEGHLSESMGIFAPVIATYDRLKGLARKEHTKVAPPRPLPEDCGNISAELYHLHRNFLQYAVEAYDGEAENIFVFAGENEYQEAEYILSLIKELSRQGYRYRDMVILSRNLDTYRQILKNGFLQYDIPYFMDERKSIEFSPVIRLVSALLEGASGRYTGEKMLHILKSGLTKFKGEDIAQVENYLYTWSGHKLSFEQEFTHNPSGFSPAFTEEDKNRLDAVNYVRAELVRGLEILKDHAKKKTAQDIGNGLYETMACLGVQEALEAQAKQYIEENKLAEAEEMQRLWETLIEIFSQLHTTSVDRKLDVQYYSQLFNMVSKTYSLGESPQNLDMVLVGSAERMRVEAPKILFVLGANEGVFPASGKKGGIFSDQEREELLEIGLEVDAPSYTKMMDERYLAFDRICLPTQKLFVSYKKASIGGAPAEPSEIIHSMLRIFPSVSVMDFDRLGLLHFCQTERNSFAKLAEHFSEDSKETALLRQFFAKHEFFQYIFKKLYNSLNDMQYQLANQNLASELYGKKIRLSPTKVEDFKKCKFAYFCKNGLKIRPLKKAELNPLEQGNIYHSVLNDVLLDFDRFLQEDREGLQKHISHTLEQYADKNLGGKEDKTQRFQYLYKRHQKPLTDVLERIQKEFSQSRFKPEDFEIAVQEEPASADGRGIPPMKVVSENGVEIVLEGRIDRVDVYRDGDTSYVRVVDYKTGSKMFSFKDVPYGLNMQMMFYLFTIWENGSVRYGTVLPAGILYMPVGEPSVTLHRNAEENEAETEKEKQYKMKGIVLEEPSVIEAMEKIEHGEYASYLPLRLAKSGQVDSRYKDNVVTQDEMETLRQYARKVLVDMTEDLYKGNIEAVPMEGACQYCDYAAVCGFEEGDAVVQVEERTKEQVLQEITQKEDGQ